MSYWKDVPAGIWTVTDPVDAVNALNERDSLVYYDAFHHRIDVFGPKGKAIIIDLKVLMPKLVYEDVKIQTVFNDLVRDFSIRLKKMKIKKVTMNCIDVPLTDLEQIKQGEIQWKS